MKSIKELEAGDKFKMTTDSKKTFVRGAIEPYHDGLSVS
jgi:hypothetical protein